MNIEMIIKGVFLCFLVVFTFQDIKNKEIDIFGIIIFYIFIIVSCIYRGIMGKDFDFIDIVLGILSGAILLPVAKLNILGEGDALVFIGSGAFLGIKNNLLLFFISVFTVSLFALFMGVYGMARGKSIRNMNVAMLPFVTLANCILWFLYE